MRTFAMTLMGLGIVVGTAAGCASEPAVERVPVAAAGNPDARTEYARPKPLPDNARLYDRDREYAPEPPFYDPPLVSQKTPEQARFEQAYRGVGKPRITVFVNRTLEGAALPVNDKDALGERRYLKRGEYDEAQAKTIDYAAMETILTDFLACQGAVEIMSPTMARQKLTDEQIKDLQSGKPRVLREIAQQLDTDVLIQVSAHPTRQTEQGLEVRLVGEALNIKGGQQVGRAVVDIVPPLDKPTLNKYTRYVARKLMADLTQNWGAAPEKPATDPK